MDDNIQKYYEMYLKDDWKQDFEDLTYYDKMAIKRSPSFIYWNRFSELGQSNNHPRKGNGDLTTVYEWDDIKDWKEQYQKLVNELAKYFDSK